MKSACHVLELEQLVPLKASSLCGPSAHPLSSGTPRHDSVSDRQITNQRGRGGLGFAFARRAKDRSDAADQEKSLGTDCRRHGDTLKEPITWAHARAGAPLAAHARSILVVPSPSPPTTRPYSRQVSSALLPPKSRHVAVTYPPWSRHVSTLHTDICRMSPLRCHRCTSCSATPPPSRSFPLP